MALHDLELEHEAIDVSINSKTGQVAVLNHRSVDLYDYSTRKRNISDPKLSRSLLLPQGCGTPYQVVLSNAMQIAILTQTTDNAVHLHRLNLDGEIFDEAAREPLLEPVDIASISATVDTDVLYGETLSGKVQRFGATTSCTASLCLPTFCPWTEVIENQDSAGLFQFFFQAILTIRSRWCTVSPSLALSMQMSDLSPLTALPFF
jgi:hypothetical protein